MSHGCFTFDCKSLGDQEGHRIHIQVDISIKKRSEWADLNDIPKLKKILYSAAINIGLAEALQEKPQEVKRVIIDESWTICPDIEGYGCPTKGDKFEISVLAKRSEESGSCEL